MGRKYYHFPGVRWIIQLLQQRIPILWGGFGPQSVARAAERGYHLIAFDVTGTYDRVMHEHGRPASDYLIGFVNRISIAKTCEEAFEAVAERARGRATSTRCGQTSRGIKLPNSAAFTVDDIRRAWESGTFRGGPFSVPTAGTVDDVTEHFLKIVRGEMGLITHVGLHVRELGTKTEDVRRTMTLFAQEVLPVLREEAARIEASRTAPV